MAGKAHVVHVNFVVSQAKILKTLMRSLLQNLPIHVAIKNFLCYFEVPFAWKLVPFQVHHQVTDLQSSLDLSESGLRRGKINLEPSS